VPEMLVEDAAVPRQGFWRAYAAAVLALLYVRGAEALAAPDGFIAGVWLRPLTLGWLVLLPSLVLALAARLTTAVYIRPWAAMRAAGWRDRPTLLRWVGYGIPLLIATYLVTASFGLRGFLFGVLGLVGLTALNSRLQEAAHPWRLFLRCAVPMAAVPMTVFLWPVPAIRADTPIIWVARDDHLAPSQTPVYWQPGQVVMLQWRGKTYRLDGLSPAFAIRRREVLSLDGRDLVVSPLRGAPRRIALQAALPNYQFILNMQPGPDGVMCNVYGPARAGVYPADHSVLRVNLRTGDVRQVPRAYRVRGAANTSRYFVNWSMERPLQTRDGHDRVLRQHGRYPFHFREWEADPVDDLLALAGWDAVTLIGPDSITMFTIAVGMPVASLTMQPGHRQLWVADRNDPREYADRRAASRLRMYTYSGRLVGERTLAGREIVRAMPVEEDVARYLLARYAPSRGE